MDVDNKRDILSKESDTYINLDKLAQLRSQTEKLDLNRVLEKRARAKYITVPLVLGLLNHNPHEIMIKSYWNTYYCVTNVLKTPDGNLKAKYCKNRFCLVCSRIKTANYINTYLEIIRSLPDKQFVTLTIKNISFTNLLSKVDEMQKNFGKIINLKSLRKKVKGIRKLEITYNPLTDEYHPHFHIIVSGSDIAEEILKRWLECYKDSNIKGQDIKRIDNDENSLLEIFKYATKIIQKDIDSPKLKTVYFNALNNILFVLRGKRTFQPFGIKKPFIEDLYSIEIENKSSDIEFYHWEQELSDWVSKSGEILSGYQPSQVIREFVNRIGKKVKYP